MKIDLDQLEQQPVEFDCRLDLEPERLDPSQVAERVEVRVVGSVRRQRSGWLLDAAVEGSGALLCSRCLAPVPWQVEESFSIHLLPAEDAPQEEEVDLTEDELDAHFITDRVLDLEDVAADQVMLALPMRVLCRDDCAGLCPTCGADRNRGESCRCEPESDPRWAALRDLSGPPS